jgi:hypothetical protein
LNNKNLQIFITSLKVYSSKSINRNIIAAKEAHKRDDITDKKDDKTNWHNDIIDGKDDIILQEI